MNTHIATRLLAIQQSLMAHYAGGAGLPSAVKGSEREYLIHDYFAQVLPPMFRFGRGSITDSVGTMCGQIEVVLELPFGPSFPMPAGKERLYLADCVAAVIEVKSDLSSQWHEVIETTAKVKRLVRDLRQPELLAFESSPSPEFSNPNPRSVPCYAVGYRGYKTVERLRARVASTSVDSRPDGALVVESGCFVGLTGTAEGACGLFALVAELAVQLNDVLGIAYPRLLQYGFE